MTQQKMMLNKENNMTDQQYKQEAEPPAGNAEEIHIALDDNGVLTVSGKGELYPYFDFNPLANIAPDPTDPMGFLAKNAEGPDSQSRARSHATQCA